jgi:hypothetical protein
VAPSEDIKLADLPRFQRSLAEQPNAIVSSEGFQNLDPKALADTFPPGETLIIVYLREQLGYLLSSYAQQVQAEVSTESFADFARSWDVDYEAFLDAWADVFDLDCIRVRLYDRERLARRDVVRDFLEAIGIPWCSRFSQGRADQNASLTYLLILLKMLLNRLISDREQRSWYLYGTFGQLASIDSSQPTYFPVDPTFAASLRSRHQASNRRVSQRYFGSRADVFRYPELRDSGMFTSADVQRMLTELELTAPKAVALLAGAVSDPAFLASISAAERRLAINMRSHLTGESTAESELT